MNPLQRQVPANNNLPPDDSMYEEGFSKTIGCYQCVEIDKITNIIYYQHQEKTMCLLVFCDEKGVEFFVTT